MRRSRLVGSALIALGIGAAVVNLLGPLLLALVILSWTTAAAAWSVIDRSSLPRIADRTRKLTVCLYRAYLVASQDCVEETTTTSRTTNRLERRTY